MRISQTHPISWLRLSTRFLSFVFVFLVLACPSSVSLRFDRILFVGNSITFTAPNIEEHNWRGAWGCCSTAAHLDYAHQVWAGIAARQGYVPEMQLVTGEIPDVLPTNIGEIITEYQPDLIIVQMGDGKQTFGVAPATWIEMYGWIGNATREVGAKTIAVGLWATYPNDVRHEYQRAAIEAAKMIYVPIADLHTGQTEAWPDGICAKPGVCWHPGNWGMALIAERILEAIYPPQTAYLPFAANAQGGTVPVGE